MNDPRLFPILPKAEHDAVMLHLRGLSARAIARALRLSRNTVRAILSAHAEERTQPSSALPAPRVRASARRKVDLHLPRIKELLQTYPTITAQRVYEELRDEGYDGHYGAIKRRVRQLRPKKRPPACGHIEPTGPGEMAENDWSPYTIDFVNTGRAIVHACSYVLCWSRRKAYALFENEKLNALMEGHVQAFTRFDGVAKACKYDSQKAVVLGWEGRQPILNPRFVAFATYYEFRIAPCLPGHPNHKPFVERSFWEFEKSFLNGRRFLDLCDMRAQLVAWMDRTCDVRRNDKTKRVAIEEFAKEKPHLLPLPAHPYDTARVLYRVCSVDGYVSVDGNKYAVPYEYVTDILPLRVTERELFIYAADLRLLIRHELAPRGAGATVEPPDVHRLSPRRGADLDQLRVAYEEMGEEGARFLVGLVNAKDRFAGHHARQILLLRERWSTASLLVALRHAANFGAFEHQAVARILAARAAPRSLAQYVDESLAQKLREPGRPNDAFLHELDDYDHLPVTSAPKEIPPCQNENPHQDQHPNQMTSSADSKDTSTSSD
jgi:transposase